MKRNRIEKALDKVIRESQPTKIKASDLLVALRKAVQTINNRKG